MYEIFRNKEGKLEMKLLDKYQEIYDELLTNILNQNEYYPISSEGVKEYYDIYYDEEIDEDYAEMVAYRINKENRQAKGKE